MGKRSDKKCCRDYVRSAAYHAAITEKARQTGSTPEQVAQQQRDAAKARDARESCQEQAQGPPAPGTSRSRPRTGGDRLQRQLERRIVARCASTEPARLADSQDSEDSMWQECARPPQCRGCLVCTRPAQDITKHTWTTSAEATRWVETVSPGGLVGPENVHSVF